LITLHLITKIDKAIIKIEMKKFFNISLVALLSIFMIVSCGKESPFGGDDSSTGTLSIKKMVVSIENEEKVVRSAYDVSTFIVDIYSGSEIYDSYVYASMPEVITLPVGDYSVKVRSGELQDVAWDAPYFEGEQSFTIKTGQITEVDTVTCKLANVRVTILFDEKLYAAMSDDAVVNVKVGNSEANFTRDETRSAYFAYVSGSNTLVATFNGVVDGDQLESFKTYTDVAPGNHYKISYLYHEAGESADEGNVQPGGVLVDVKVEEENLAYNVDVEDSYIDATGRPTTGDKENNDNSNTPGSGDDSSSKAEPTIVGVSPIDIDAINDVDGSKAVGLVVSSTATGGITGLVVTIDSPILTEDELVGVGLAKNLDLVNPGDLSGAISGFGFPVGDDVKGKSTINLEISSVFMGLLKTVSGTDTVIHKFIITVTDANGSTTKTLSLRFNG
jgi:hypothetical protein